MSTSYSEIILWLSYIIGSVSFIVGLKMLSHPESARRGNLVAAAGMTLAIVATLFFYRTPEGEHLRNIPLILAAMALGSFLGTQGALRVKMTAMPQMVSLFNGMGGACAAMISLMEYSHNVVNGPLILSTIAAGLIIGGISFSGSLIAFLKLNGNLGDFRYQGQNIVNGLLLILLIALGAWLTFSSFSNLPLLYSIAFLTLLYGVLFVLPIGGADMPVVISLLNSFTGVAAAFGGFLYNNQIMLTGGILVGSAGTILTVLMCKAMNRSLLNVLIGNFGGTNAAQGQAQGAVREIQVSDAAVLLAYSKKVMVVPGYGLAVAQAQHICHELEKILEEKGVEVKYAIHPVAGRMPGHMNVLLAEADVPYTKLLEMEEANSEMPSTDVVVVVGANDVVNPAAKNNPSSPIYGMPILEVEEAQNVIVLKRSMGKGYAGIENELFYSPKTRMLFGDAKDSLQKLLNEIKNL
ncbi:MAG: NAD(P)(+) transhydrogenase (Re/Si-specific) subunit beta [Flavobacteriales bacterium]|nr:NAD(P)(+) transhydrogenase (Re/Si-specific) subunit beta [Flavobacteriales bacterium]MCX7767867.1 NAD(P)(+) transhydrogenase (Re/Si-specific) subunit beta [Flavobacteriales bacterium]MDW8410482.1 NAD(P)(+) transhydrogenase (Re/Si-specific) subunit beta [Flavobacteriales bacterium]